MLGSTFSSSRSNQSRFERYLSKSKKDPKLALLVAAMLHARTANTMDLAAHLPLKAPRYEVSMDFSFSIQLFGQLQRNYDKDRATLAKAISRKDHCFNY